ncbi:MAG: ABC transporter permease [Candidatus Azambacteria bacterium]|nr:ABC transporter permease [Candidatus Azambacteria bacterium]
MRAPDILKLSTRMFRSRLMRTFLTILGIGIGIGAIMFLVSLGYGLQRALISQITSSDSLLSLDVVQGDKAALILDNAVIEAIAQFPEVKDIAPLVSLKGQVEYEGTTADIIANITTLNFLKFSNLKLVDGKMIDPEKNEILISQAVARVFNIEDTKELVGKGVDIAFLATVLTEEGYEQLDLIPQTGKFIIAGVVGDESSSFIYFPLGKVGGVTIDAYSQAKVRVTSTDTLDIVRNKILDMGFSVAALSDVIDQANKIFNILQIILAIFGIVALVVSAIGMFNTMTIALMERTQEVGIMKALGASKMDIMYMFVTEAVIMGFLGGLVGLIIGFLGGEILNFLLNILAKRVGGNAIDIFYTPLWFALTIAGFSTFVGFITGLWPARRAARLNPLEAVKYK